MNLEELNKKEEHEFTEEERQQIKEFAEQMFIQNNKGHLQMIAEYLDRKDITVKDAIHEVEDKRSGLSKRCRDILLWTNLELLEKWFPHVENRRKKHV